MSKQIRPPPIGMNRRLHFQENTGGIQVWLKQKF